MILVQISTSPTVMGGVWARLGLFGRGRYRNTILYQHSQRTEIPEKIALRIGKSHEKCDFRVSYRDLLQSSFGKPTWVRFMKIWYGFARKRVYLM